MPTLKLNIINEYDTYDINTKLIINLNHKPKFGEIIKLELETVLLTFEVLMVFDFIIIPCELGTGEFSVYCKLVDKSKI